MSVLCLFFFFSSSFFLFWGVVRKGICKIHMIANIATGFLPVQTQSLWYTRGSSWSQQLPFVLVSFCWKNIPCLSFSYFSIDSSNSVVNSYWKAKKTKKVPILAIRKVGIALRNGYSTQGLCTGQASSSAVGATCHFRYQKSLYVTHISLYVTHRDLQQCGSPAPTSWGGSCKSCSVGNEELLPRGKCQCVLTSVANMACPQ